jgi:hypothetical protein
MRDPELAFYFTVGLILMILHLSETEKEFWGYIIGLISFGIGFLVLLAYL